MPMLIVLDTTETFGDLRLEGPDYVFLRSYVSRHPVSLLVPQIVVEETVNHFREKLQAAIDEANRALRAVERLSPNLVENLALDCDFDQEVAAYSEQLQARLALFHATQPIYEGIRISSLVGRALARRKPFDSKGSTGFRDCLMWESVLSCIVSEKPREVVLVTRNKHDFGEHGRLADDLAADLVPHGASQTTVVVCEGLQRFVNERIKPSLETLDEIQEKLNEGEFEALDPGQFFEDWWHGIRDALAEIVERIDLERLTGQCMWHFSRPSLGHIAVHPEGYEVVDVWRISQNEFGIGMELEVPGSISCLRETSTEPYGEPFDEEFDGKARFKMQMTLVFNEQAREVDSWELNDLEVELTGDWGFPERD